MKLEFSYSEIRCIFRGHSVDVFREQERATPPKSGMGSAYEFPDLRGGT